MKISLVCGAVFITVVSASYQPRPLPLKYGPAHRGVYGGARGHGGGIDPLTLLLLHKDGGGNGGINRLLPLLLTGGGLSGKAGHVNPLIFTLLGNRGVGSGVKNLLPLILSGGLGGKKGDISPLLLTGLLGDKCIEDHPYGCTQPTIANANPQRLCGDDPGFGCSGAKCCPCCTCPDTVETGCGGGRSGVSCPRVCFDTTCDVSVLRNGYAYQYFPYNGERFDFKVEARAEVHVALDSDENESDLYEIVIGGWGNTLSMIRRGKQGPNIGTGSVDRGSTPGQKGWTETPGIVSASEFRGFWITSQLVGNKLEIKVGKDGECEPFMTGSDPNPLRVQKVGISAFTNTDASYIF